MTVERYTYVLRKYRFIIGLSISRNDRMSSVLMEDITSAEFSTGVIGGPVDYITAIGVMFHIVDDERWKRAVQNLAAVLKPDGVMFIGGDFDLRLETSSFIGRTNSKSGGNTVQPRCPRMRCTSTNG